MPQYETEIEKIPKRKNFDTIARLKNLKRSTRKKLVVQEASSKKKIQLVLKKMPQIQTKIDIKFWKYQVFEIPMHFLNRFL